MNPTENYALNANFCSGTFYMCRGSNGALPIFNTYKVDTMSSWNQNTGTLNSTSAYTSRHVDLYPSGGLPLKDKTRLTEVSPREHFLTIVNYKGTEWVALYPGYILQGHSVYFDGVVSDTTDNKTDFLKIVLLEEVGLHPYNTQDPAKGWQTVNEWNDIDWKKTAGNQVFGRRFYNQQDVDGFGTGESSKNATNEPKFKGKYGETILKSVLYADGYGFNWRNNTQRRGNTTQNSDLKGHIGGIDYADIQIIAPLRFWSPYHGNDSYYRPWEEWPRNPDHPAPLGDVPQGTGVAVLNSMGVKKIVVHRAIYESSGGDYWLTGVRSGWNEVYTAFQRSGDPSPLKYTVKRPAYLYFDMELNNYYGFEPFGYSLHYDIRVVDSYKFPFHVGPLTMSDSSRNAYSPFIQVNPESEEPWDPWYRGTDVSQNREGYRNTRVRVHVPIWYASISAYSNTMNSTDVKNYHNDNKGNTSYIRLKVKLTWIKND
jgi:hypothetical protein